MKNIVRFSHQALIDLEGIVEYFHHLSPKTASKYYYGIINATKRLRPFPEIGRIVPEFEEDYIDDYRELILENYRIIYRIEETTCFIVRIIDARRLLTFDFIKSVQ